MNSSVLSSNHLSFNSSISQQRHDCSHLELYKKTYNQLSTLRIELRATQQETSVMKNTVRGLEEENKYLKGFLSNKKEMITKLNYQIGCCNQEINRLEEELSRQRDLKSELEQKYNNCLNTNKQLEMRVIKQKQITKTLQEKVRVVQQQLKNKVINVQADEELKQQKEALKQVCRLMQVNLQAFKKQKNSYQFNSTSAKSEIVNETVRQFNKKWNELIQAHKFQILQMQMAASTQKNQSNLLKANLQKLKLELAQEKNKVQIEKDRMEMLMTELQKKQVQNEEISNRYSSINKNKECMFKKLINELLQALKKYLGEQNHVLIQKILNLSEKTEPESFEMEVLINQLWNMANLRYALMLKYELQSKKVQKVNQELLQLQEQFELLTLNHRTLQREYKELLQDNRRLINYNTISQFRLRRNVVLDSNDQKDEPIELRNNPKEEKAHTFRTQRKDVLNQKISTKTRSVFATNKENDFTAYNQR